MSDHKAPDDSVQESVAEEVVEGELETAAEGAAAETQDTENLARALEAAEQQAQENWDKAVRAQAEMENLRRRAEKDVKNAHLFSLEKFAKELLPVMDSLELGIEAAQGDVPELVKLREGSELTLKQFQAAFDRFNIVAVDPTGEPFNPEQHQAMAMQPDADAKPNTVLKVFQKGYLLNERLLRPAMVVVAQATGSGKIDEQA